MLLLLDSVSNVLKENLLVFLFYRFQISCSKMCMVGDRLDTDILFGKNAGCKTLLVFSGKWFSLHSMLSSCNNGGLLVIRDFADANETAVL